MHSSGHLDWLTVTFPLDFDEKVLEAYMGAFHNVGTGAHGYARRATTSLGAILQADGAPGMGKSLTLPGKTLESLRAILDTDRPVLDLLVSGKGRASRVDFALNIHESTLTIADLWEQYITGLVYTKARGNEAISTKDGGIHAFYIGSRKSDKFMRVYDKALEQHLDGVAWLRLELECRRLVARTYVGAMVEQKLLRPFINRAIGDFCSFSASQVFREAIADDKAELPQIQRTIPAFWQWLERQVIPAMVGRQLLKPEENVMREINRLFQALLKKRRAQVQSPDPLFDKRH